MAPGPSISRTINLEVREPHAYSMYILTDSHTGGETEYKTTTWDVWSTWCTCFKHARGKEQSDRLVGHAHKQVSDSVSTHWLRITTPMRDNKVSGAVSQKTLSGFKPWQDLIWTRHRVPMKFENKLPAFSRFFPDISGLFPDLKFSNDLPRSNTGTVILNTIKARVHQSWINYNENVCQKIKSGKLFPFSILTDQKNCFPDFQTGKWPRNVPYFSRLRRNPGETLFPVCSDQVCNVRSYSGQLEELPFVDSLLLLQISQELLKLRIFLPWQESRFVIGRSDWISDLIGWTFSQREQFSRVMALFCRKVELVHVGVFSGRERGRIRSEDLNQT